MRDRALAAAALAFGALGVLALQDGACAANIRSHIETVRRNASVVYLGVVDDIELSERQPGRRLEARADVRVLFVGRSPAEETPSKVTLDYPTWDDEHAPHDGDGQYRLDPGSIVVVFANSWGGRRVKYLLEGGRDELLKDLESRRRRLIEMSDEDLEFHEIDEGDRQVQVQLYRRLAAYLE